ncbi:ABC transporter ATP-binding protein [Carnobacterium gallinarum]|uniref:ABC transporter ATP-binding protein n=1 Tax=Carnobacterium gallinarum TaxID=2749 RepID=UPI0005510DB6|nr:ABC transporter ATP-binding protein [Carnobacterium gallinarum]
MEISIHELEKNYQTNKVLKPTTLTISEKFTTILGESGCGKTTMLKMLAGLVEPTEGMIKFDDEVIYSRADKVNVKPNKRMISMVFQDFALWPHMSIFENVAFGLKKLTDLSKNERQERVMDVLKMVNLENFKDRKPGELSGGQQQRVALARAIAPQPKLILFDEPLSALDAVLRERMQQEILNLVQQTNCQAIFVTHDQGEAMTMSDQILIMEKGHVIQLGSPTEIYHQPKTKYVANFIGKVNWLTEKQFLRPEKITMSKNSAMDVIEKQIKIEKSTFVGDRYLINGKVDGYEWEFYYAAHQEIGSTCSLFFQAQDLITLED